MIRSPIRSAVRSAVRSNVRGEGGASLLAQATSQLGGVAPYHWWDFINNRALFAQADVGALSSTPGWSFTRASTGYAETVAGTLTAFASGELRRTDKGVLIEGARTNLCLRSQEFGATWSAYGNKTVVADQAVAPDGTTTADSFTSTNNGNGITQAFACSGATTYTLSVFVKANVGTQIQLAFSSTGGATANNNSNHTIASGTPYANGFYRVSKTFTTGAGDTALEVRILAAANNDAYFIWGAQVEAGAFPSSYIPTTTASATRAADTLVVSSPGVTYPLSLFTEFERVVDTGGSEVVFNVNRGTLLNESFIHINSSDQVSGWTLDGAGTTADDPVTGACAVGVIYKAAARLATNDVRVARSGTLSTGDTSCAMPTTPTALHFGVRYDGVSPLFGYLRRAAIINSAVNNAGLTAMTT